MNSENWTKLKGKWVHILNRLREKGVKAEGPEILAPIPDEQITEFETETGLKLPADLVAFLKLSGGFSIFWCLSSAKIGDDRWLRQGEFSPMASFGGMPNGHFIGANAECTLLRIFRAFQEEVADVAESPRNSDATGLRQCFPLIGDNGDFLVLILGPEPPEIHFLDHETTWTISPKESESDESYITSGFSRFLEDWTALGCPEISELISFRKWLGGQFDPSHPRAKEWIDWLLDPNIKIEVTESTEGNGKCCLAIVIVLLVLLVLAIGKCVTPG